MNHKHVLVVIEELEYSRSIETQAAINNITNYIECVEKGNSEEHYVHCVLNKEELDV